MSDYPVKLIDYAQDISEQSTGIKFLWPCIIFEI